MRTAKTLIRLGGCPGWSESSLGAHAILLVLSWGACSISNIRLKKCCCFLSRVMIIQYLFILQADNECPDHNVWLRRLIWVFVAYMWHKGHFSRCASFVQETTTKTEQRRSWPDYRDARTGLERLCSHVTSCFLLPNLSLCELYIPLILGPFI